MGNKPNAFKVPQDDNTKINEEYFPLSPKDIYKLYAKLCQLKEAYLLHATPGKANAFQDGLLKFMDADVSQLLQMLECMTKYIRDYRRDFPPPKSDKKAGATSKLESSDSHTVQIQSLQSKIKCLQQESTDKSQSIARLRDQVKCLNAEKDDFQRRKAGTASKPEFIDSHVAERQSLESEMKRLQQESADKSKSIERLGDRVKHLTAERDDFQKRLSEEWVVKVGENETSLENIGIKNRPMNVAGEYETLCAGTWLNAKESIDKFLTIQKGGDKSVEILTEAEKLKLLCNTIMQAEKVAQLKYKKVSFTIFELLTIQAEKGAASSSKLPTNAIFSSSQFHNGHQYDDKNVEKGYENIPVGMKNAIGDVLRTCADTADISGVIEEIKEELKQKLTREAAVNKLETIAKSMTIKVEKPQPTSSSPKGNRDTLPANPAKLELKPDICANAAQKILQKFIDDFGRLAWKMVTQRPQMRFDDKTGIGEPWKGEKFQEVHFSSKDPKDPKHVVKYYVHPALMHNTTTMKIGRVYVG